MRWTGKRWIHPGPFVLACAVSVLALLVLDFGGKVEAETWYVDDDTPDGGNGSKERPFNKIQDALNASRDGDTVRVFEGVYKENVFVNETVSLIGNSSTNTTINGGGMGDVVRVLSDWVNVSGFNVTGSGDSPHAGIYVLANHTRVHENLLFRNHYGVCFNPPNEQNTIEENTCRENTYGIALREGEKGTLSGNTCTSNSRYGIWLSGGGSNIVTDNDCSGNGEYGIILWEGSHGNTIHRNNCSYNGRAIHLWDSERNMLRENRCLGDFDGISLHETGNTTLEGNIMVDCGVMVAGDELWHWTTHTIDNSNTVDGKPVIFVKNQTGGVVPAGAGEIILANCTDVTVKDQDCSNGSAGVLMGFSSDIELANISCSLNTRSGIFLFSCDNITLSRVSCQENGDYGISLRSSNSCSFSNTNCSRNYYGVSLRQSASNRFANGTVSENHGAGILIRDSGNNSFSGNTITGNKNGIQFLGSSENNSAHENAISGNRWYGVDASINGGNDFDARRNWWGDESGPYHPDRNTRGKGDNITDNVEFDPWTGKPSYQPPQAIIDSVVPGSALEKETVTFTGHGEGDCDIVRYVWRSELDGVLYNGTSPEFSSSILSNGTHAIYFKVGDECGGWSGEVGTTLAVNGIPRARINQIAPDTAFENDTITFTGQGSDDGDVTSFSWRSSRDGELYNGTNASFQHSNLSVGTHTIFLKVMDDQDVWSSELSALLIINAQVQPNRKPIVAITTPANNSEVAGVVNITGTAFDQDGSIMKVELSVNGSAWMVTEGGGSWWFAWNSSSVVNGSYTISVHSFDGELYSDVLHWRLTVANEKENDTNGNGNGNGNGQGNGDGGEDGGDGENDEDDENEFALWLVVVVVVVVAVVVVVVYKRR